MRVLGISRVVRWLHLALCIGLFGGLHPSCGIRTQPQQETKRQPALPTRSQEEPEWQRSQSLSDKPPALPPPSPTPPVQAKSPSSPRKAPSDWRVGLEIPTYVPTRNTTRLEKRGFTLLFSHGYRQPLWVAYLLEANELIAQVSRADNFAADPKLRGAHSELSDYRGSGYDRGHMAPSADMRFDVQVQAESFYLSNICPQIPRFNQGVWNDLEEKVRKWAKRYGALYVVMGPIFEDDTCIDIIGPNRVPVATHFFKAVLVEFRGAWYAVAYLLPHTGEPMRYREGQISVDSLEAFTGYDFFPQLPDSIEERAERAVEARIWN